MASFCASSSSPSMAMFVNYSISPLSSSSSSSSSLSSTRTQVTRFSCNTIGRKLFAPPSLLWVNHRKVTFSSPSDTIINEEEVDIRIESASDVVRRFYGGINRHDLDSVQDVIAEDCVYEDLVFPRPFIGRKAILDFFKKFIDSITMDLQFVIDDISAEDSSAVGVTWHLEWKGKPFPFSKGCSFYRLQVINGSPQIIYGRDSVEPAIKPGETALVAIRGVTWLLEQFPRLADWL